ncbi:MAG: AAA family ATPase [Suipraeoptans sp.]
MANNTIFAIGREFGSGGHEIGKKLSEQLGIPFYDKNLVNMAAEKLEISSITAATLDEKTLDYFLSSYNAESDGVPDDETTLPLSEQMYLVQAEIIKSLAEKGSCVIVGRCADYILRDKPNCVNIFIFGKEQEKAERVAEIYSVSVKKAKEKMKKTDAERRYYYESRTGRTWASYDSHQVLFNSSLLSIDEIVNALACMDEVIVPK